MNVVRNGYPDQDVGFVGNTNSWVAEGPKENEANRTVALERILQASHMNEQSLSLDNLGLITLPKNICNIQNLRILSLNNNALEALPEWIGTLSNIEKLSVQNNKLSNLPDSIGGLRKLNDLNICNNHSLLMIPNKLVECQKLKSFVASNKFYITKKDTDKFLEDITNAKGTDFYSFVYDVTRISEISINEAKEGDKTLNLRHNTSSKFLITKVINADKFKDLEEIILNQKILNLEGIPREIKTLKLKKIEFLG